jgi:predicted nucleic acid-binding protein
MSGAKGPFLDTNIIVYLMSGDVAKASKAESLIAGGGVISTQVLNDTNGPNH